MQASANKRRRNIYKLLDDCLNVRKTAEIRRAKLPEEILSVRIYFVLILNLSEILA